MARQRARTLGGRDVTATAIRVGHHGTSYIDDVYQERIDIDIDNGRTITAAWLDPDSGIRHVLTHTTADDTKEPCQCGDPVPARIGKIAAFLHIG